MSFDLSEFLTEGLINSVKNGLIPSDLATVYAGNYLVKSLITQTQVTQVSDAITAYKAAQVSAADKAAADKVAQAEAAVDHSSVH
ncbi:Prophage Lp2 protein 54 [Lactiplantibacillus plantarum]|nr:Prophage Lp2 protein 54 [Lactiplantibacillus plantarum]